MLSQVNKKVLFISPLPPPAGGIATWTKIIVTKGLPKDFKPIVLNTRIFGKRPVFERTSILSINELYRSVNILVSLVFQLIINRPKVVHLNCSLSALGIFRDLLCGVLARLWNVPVISHYRGNIPDFFSKNRLKMSRHALVYLSRLVQANITLNKKSSKYISRISPKNICVQIPNFIDDENFKYKVSGPNIRIRVLYVGAVTESKGCCDFIDVARSFPEKDFYMIGSPTKSMNTILRSLPENVVMLGPMKQLGVINELCSSDIFFFPTMHMEGFPNAVAEAMSVGLPVVSTRVGAIPEMVEEGRGGYLFEKGDICGFIKALHLLENSELRTRLGEYNRKKCKSQYAYSVVSLQLTNLYDRVT